MIQTIWHFVLVFLGISTIALILINIRRLVTRPKNQEIHINQFELTEFLYDCMEEYDEKPVWSSRIEKRIDTDLPLN